MQQHELLVLMMAEIKADGVFVTHGRTEANGLDAMMENKAGSSKTDREVGQRSFEATCCA
jgi:hypothetical protein